MKITEVQTHMAVRFGTRKRETTHFSVLLEKKFGKLDMTIFNNVGIRISNEEDDVIIPFVNVTAFKVSDNATTLPAYTPEEQEVLGLTEEAEDEEGQIAFTIKS